jgi:hypothetical protein
MGKFLEFAASNKSFSTKLTQVGFLSSVYHVMNPETAGMNKAFAAHSTHTQPHIITIADR